MFIDNERLLRLRLAERKVTLLKLYPEDRCAVFRQQVKQFGFQIVPGLLRVINDARPKQLVHVRTESAVPQMRVQQANKFRSSSNAAFQPSSCKCSGVVKNPPPFAFRGITAQTRNERH